jgi:hypothetical protein
MDETESIEFTGPGPFGNTNLHVTGVGLDTDGQTLTGTIRVLDMERQVTPGFTNALWTLGFDSRSTKGIVTKVILSAYYDLASDSFVYWAQESGNPPLPVTGAVVLGAGGGLILSVKLSDLRASPGHPQIEVGRILENVRVSADAYTHYFYMANDPGGGITASHSSASGPVQWPLVPCPGAALSSVDAGKGWVEAVGLILPAREDGVTLQSKSPDGGWTDVATSSTDETGAFHLVWETAAPGSHTVRAIAQTQAGEAVSAPATIASS